MSDEKIQARVEKSVQALDNTIARVGMEAKSFTNKASNQQRYHLWFKATSAILGVIAPALVTYQTSVESAPYYLLTIALVGIAGASATLQSTFGWGEKYGRTRLTTLALEELESDLAVAREDILDSNDGLQIYHKLRSLNEKASETRKDIYRKQIEAEVQIVTKEEEAPKLEMEQQS